MKFIDYLNDCLKDPEFKAYWDELESQEMLEGALKEVSDKDIWEALKLIEEESDFDYILKDKGIKATIDIPNTVEFFELDGKCPVADFLSSIDNTKLKTKTLRSIKQLAILGNKAKKPLSDHVKDGIFELRTEQHNNITRVFYFFVFGNKIILTNGYIKKNQKMDSGEFNKAKKYRNIYFENN